MIAIERYSLCHLKKLTEVNIYKIHDDKDIVQMNVWIRHGDNELVDHGRIHVVLHLR